MVQECGTGTDMLNKRLEAITTILNTSFLHLVYFDILRRLGCPKQHKPDTKAKSPYDETSDRLSGTGRQSVASRWRQCKDPAAAAGEGTGIAACVSHQSTTSYLEENHSNNR